MHYYLFRLDEPNQRSERTIRTVLICAYTGADAVAVVRETLMDTGQLFDDHAGGLRRGQRVVIHMQCLPDTQIETLMPSYMRDDLRKSGMIWIEPDQLGLGAPLRVVPT